MSVLAASSALLLGLVLSSVVAYDKVRPPSEPYAPKCLVGQDIYDPAKSYEVPWFTVDLDAPPREHYKQIVAAYKDKIPRVINIIKEFIRGLLGEGMPLIEMIEAFAEEAFEARFPKVYREELQGIAEVTGQTTADLAMMNIYYELSRFCTSLVANSADGQVFHARNLDFGQLFIWNTTTRSWALTDSLKAVTVNINFMRGGKIIFKGTTFAGHVGIITGMKPNAFTISMNAKVKPDIQNVISYFMGLKPDVHFAMWVEREVMEVANTFEEARQYLSSVQQLAGCYYILGGAKPGEGTIIVRNETSVVMEKTLNNSPDKWFILQTNYDPDQIPLFIDDRQEPGEWCMRNLTQSKVLASRTSLNKTTVHMVIMSITSGLYQTFIMYCADPCWFV